MDFKIAFTDKEITPWGGMALLKKMLERAGWHEMLAALNIPKPGSNRGYSPAQIITSFMVSIWCGANRFLHTEVTRHDAVIGSIFDWKRMCGQDTYKRFFGKFTQAMNQEVFTGMYGWFFKHLHFDNYTLDVDSTVVTRYGEQEGVRVGYNPKKPGRGSHHPLMAFVSECRMVANMWLRSGNAHTANNMCSFLEDTFGRLAHKKVGLLRADSGFCSDNILSFLEKRDTPISYIVAAVLYEPVKRLIVGHQTWLSVDKGISVAETQYQGGKWKQGRRMILVRQSLKERPKASGKRLKLFANAELYVGYRYHCFITNLELPAAQVWALYRGRADAENRIKELKYDFGFDSFAMRSFYGTEAALNVAMMAYNLMSLFRHVVLGGDRHPRMSTLRYRVFAVGGYMIKEGSSRVLKLSLAMKRRSWYMGLWEEASAFSWPDNFPSQSPIA